MTSDIYAFKINCSIVMLYAACFRLAQRTVPDTTDVTASLSTMIVTSRAGDYQRRAKKSVSVWTTNASCSPPDFLLCGFFLRAVRLCSPTTDSRLRLMLTTSSASC